MFFNDLEEARVFVETPSSEFDFEAIIYMIPNEKTDGDNIYNEYMLVDGNFELIGSTAVDLSGYQKKLVAGDVIRIDNEANTIELKLKKTNGGLKVNDTGEPPERGLCIDTDIIATNDYVDEQVGDIETALNSIDAMLDEMLGGEA